MTNAYVRRLDRQLHELGIRKRVELGGAAFEGIAETEADGLAFSVSTPDERSPTPHHVLGNVALPPFSDFHPRDRDPCRPPGAPGSHGSDGNASLLIL
ncbi:hypothetical protein ACFUIY_37215 [Streptomyces griseorubiginosus]|uniref:hypothetical protein n=1 Tax=Streptomyces griseorubiginosus TaxID=67304 RepID=UPI0015E854FF|nr:hypothetical protein [Streptomyces griseorubiginosus]